MWGNITVVWRNGRQVREVSLPLSTHLARAVFAERDDLAAEEPAACIDPLADGREGKAVPLVLVVVQTDQRARYPTRCRNPRVGVDVDHVPVQHTFRCAAAVVREGAAAHTWTRRRQTGMPKHHL